MESVDELAPEPVPVIDCRRSGEADEASQRVTRIWVFAFMEDFERGAIAPPKCHFHRIFHSPRSFIDQLACLSKVYGSQSRQEGRNSLTLHFEEDLQRAPALWPMETPLHSSSQISGEISQEFLGPINVRASRKEVQLKVKEEYNSYRDRTALLFLFSVNFACFKIMDLDGCLPAFPVQLYEAWLLFLYTGLAMRENILRINGSDIRPWWIHHHYCAIVMALISITWEIEGQPNCAQKQRGVELFLQWAMMQGVVMLLQNRYQRQRLYTRIALGKANRMDVVWGEASGVDGQLWILCPVLFLMQGFEAYVGLLLLRSAFAGVVSKWQVICCGILLVVMAVGNFVNTIQSLVTKSRFKAKMKRTKNKQELD
ncbi:gem-associated protein 2-like [Hibiscus syriacus]|uniref:Gem-associated protein 2-like n=1 Tax=Hibiscus syriacus TaxID=106335 RepID=A0A6A3BUR9_HIBSY|nr:transmembrane protein 120 homolog [Hibiscus syriacus]KAE8720600.1 gem-associated protein 2-like [Hibiscus syriacus]